MPDCGSCKAPVLWVSMEPKLSAHPLDRTPTKDGNIRVVGSARVTARVLKIAELAVARARGELLYTSHFATCPHAAQHRKKSALSSSAAKPEGFPPSAKPVAVPCVATIGDEGADLSLARTVRP
jgi:hypothetical protein